MQTANVAEANGQMGAPGPTVSRSALRALFWKSALTSLWAPISIFGVAFLAELIVVELNTSAYVWAQPLLKNFGLLMVLYFVVLLVLRLAWVQHRQLRHLRHEAGEQIRDVQRTMDRAGDKLDPKVRLKLEQQIASVHHQRVGVEMPALEKELLALHELSEKSLAAWRKNATSDWVMGFAKALLIALAIRSVFIEPFKIPSKSMVPTLEIGDQIFVNKFIYGVRIPFLNYVPFQIVRAPKRGDVIVFNNPVDESKDFIKRVIGIPGDKIQIIEGVVHVNGEPLPRKLVQRDFTYWDRSEATDGWVQDEAVLYEEFIEGQPHNVLYVTRENATDPTVFEVPPEHVFVVGDNRDHSADSRVGLGAFPERPRYVPYGNIKGKAMVIWLALGHGGVFSSLTGGTGLRTDRLFLPVR